MYICIYVYMYIYILYICIYIYIYTYIYMYLYMILTGADCDALRTRNVKQEKNVNRNWICDNVRQYVRMCVCVYLNLFILGS